MAPPPTGGAGVAAPAAAPSAAARAHALEYFEHLLNAATLKHILGYHRQMCELLGARPGPLPGFYPRIKSGLETSWRAKALWKRLDARATHKCYGRARIAAGTRVLIIGGGPCGLRAAVEAQLLGARVVVVEKRDRFSRNNVLHLWPFVIEDLRALGAKKFFGRFCAGAIDHISIRQLQCILLKAALLLGVEVHAEVGFGGLVEPDPNQKTGWRGKFSPENHPVSQYEFDVVLGADGKRNTLEGFKRKEFRGKLAIAITANFINKKTEAEARVEEISGVAFIFNQKFFKDLLAETRIDLENIVYYKDDTHYFVMTAKKASLLEKGVIKQDLADTEKLLAPDNVDRDALQSYAREAADFSTDYQMPDLDFAVNHYGQADVAMFDFTSMYAAEYASKVLDRNGHRLLMMLVGDSLLEPFWPTGSGCARGFLSSLDAAWAIRSWSMGNLTPLDVLAERESIYRLLAQTTPDNLNKDWKSYTLDPATRYPNLNKTVVVPHQTACLYDTDNPDSVERMKRISHEPAVHDAPKKRRRGNVDNGVLLAWLAEQLAKRDDITISDIGSVYKSGKPLCAIINHYRPDLLDYGAVVDGEPSKNNQLAFEVFEKELGIVPIMTGEESVNTEDYLTMASYLTQVYDTFRGEIPHIKHPKLSSGGKMKSKIPQSIPNNPQIVETTHSDSRIEESKDACKTGAKKYKIIKLKKRKTEAILNRQFNKTVESVFSKFSLGENDLNCLDKSRGDKNDAVNSGDSIKEEIKIIAKKLSQKRKKSREQKSGLTTIPEKIEKIQSTEDLKVKSERTFVVASRSGIFDRKRPEFRERGTQNDLNMFRCDVVNIHEMPLPKVPSENPYYSETSSKQEVFSSDFLVPSLPKRPKPRDFLPKTDSRSSVEIRIMEKKSRDTVTFQKIRFKSSMNLITISSKTQAGSVLASGRGKGIPRKKRFPTFKFNNDDQPATGRLSPVDREIIDTLGCCRTSKLKFRNRKMSISEVNPAPSVVASNRVTDWVYSQNFDDVKRETAATVATNFSGNDYDTDITSVTRTLMKNKSNRAKGEYDDVIVEERTDIIKCESPITSSEENLGELKRFLAEKKDTGFPKIRKLTRVEKLKSTSEPMPHCSQYSSILEGEENELPESNKRSENSLKTLKTVQPSAPFPTPVSRPSSRHKRHVEAPPPKPYSVDKKTRKRRTLERLGSSVVDRQKVLEDIASNRADRQSKRRQQRKYQTEQFLKSMQMLQANAKFDDSQPFEDYSIFLYRQTAPKFEDRVKDLERQFTYVPDHESKSNVQRERRGSTAADEDIAAKIKNLENKWSTPTPVDKRPKDLLRAIGKIDNSDWNIKEIEKKILENKMGRPSSQNRDKEKVPKWSKEQFLARQTKMEGKHLDRRDSGEAKYADIDKNIRSLDLKLREGTSRDPGQNKVASIAEKLTNKVPGEARPAEKTGQKPALPGQNPSEYCHFCGKRVYLMERLSAEGRFFHHGCFKCQYCHTQLRLGSYTFDRDGTFGYKFFCVHHYGLQGEVPRGKSSRKPPQRKSPVKKPLPGVSGVDLLDRVQTPERIEFANLSNVSSDHEDVLSQMDEDEWTDKNFGPSCAELDDSDEDSSSVSDTDSDDEGAYDDALEEPATKEGTMKWAERWKNSYSRKRRGSESDGYSSSDRSSYYENSSDDSESDTATEGEEEIRQRELRKREVHVEPPIVQTDTGTETEIVSDETTSESSSEVQNSATEISTDSEFAHDEPTPTRDAPPAVPDDFVTKTRGSSSRPRKIQVTSGYIPKSKRTAAPRPDIELKLRPLVPNTPVAKTTIAPFAGYALNRTQSTGGIAAKVSLELKKRYLLGEGQSGGIQKSGSASALDNKFKSFQSTISDCQKLLRPAIEVVPNKSDELPPPDVTITTIAEKAETFQNESEGRPRSPAHETSINVPHIDWTKNKRRSSDSLSPSSENEPPTTPIFRIPRVEVTEEDNIAPDSLTIDEIKTLESRASNHSNSEAPKSIPGERKALNQPKALPKLDNVLPSVHDESHVKKDEHTPENESGGSSPEATAALTETELSDWARDGAVSGDELELELSDAKTRRVAKMAEAEDFSKAEAAAAGSLLNENLDSIEFMDTGTETSSEGVVDSQNGYVLLRNEDEMMEDSLDPNVNEKIENKVFCVIADENNRFGSEVIDIKPSDLERMRQKILTAEHEEDSLLIIEKDATTEENTCSDSTVKNVTEIAADTKLAEQMHKQRLERKLSDLKERKPNEIPNVEFEKHCQRLESKVDFGNAKDSMDVRKTRRKSKSEPPQKPDLIQEENTSPKKEITLDLSPAIRTPDILYKKENIKKERDINQKLIQEMVLNKMKAENKSLERKKRIRSPYEISKSSTADIGSRMQQNRPLSTYATPDLLSNSIPLQNSQSVVNVPDSQKNTPTRPLSVFTDVKKYPEPTLSSLENASMPDIRRNLFGDEFKTPVAPPRLNRTTDLNKTAEKMKENARARVRLLSNEDLGLSPEDKLSKLREKVKRGKENENADGHIQESIESLVLNTERRNSILYSNDTLTKKKNNSFRRSKSGDGATIPKLSAFNDDIARTKSISELPKNGDKPSKFVCKSDPNLLDTDTPKPKKKSKDRERRKSITKLIANIFTKKSPTNGGKGLFSKLSPKTKEISKEPVIQQQIRHKSFSELSIQKGENTPPPIPPLPLNYTGGSVHATDDSSDGEHQWKGRERGSCDTLDQSGALDNSNLSLSGRRAGKSARKAARQAQLKRHRMAQEIQRKLEETEVKTRELEQKGVGVEKALRGEDDGENSKDESELLQEWFDLMRDRTELGRYEKELMVRAQELELEDRHARLQRELRERLETNEPKTQHDIEAEEQIINEMMEIVSRRDTLVSVLEEDKLRYSNEDRDLEERMLAKGLQLTPILKTPEK